MFDVKRCEIPHSYLKRKGLTEKKFDILSTNLDTIPTFLMTSLGTREDQIRPKDFLKILKSDLIYAVLHEYFREIAWKVLFLRGAPSEPTLDTLHISFVPIVQCEN